MKKYLLPKTNLGKISVILILLFPIFTYMGMLLTNCYQSVPAGKTILEDIISRPGVAMSMLLGFISGILAFFTGLYAIVKNKDYSILVFISSIVGFFVLLWFLLEIILQH